MVKGGAAPQPGKSHPISSCHTHCLWVEEGHSPHGPQNGPSLKASAACGFSKGRAVPQSVAASPSESTPEGREGPCRVVTQVSGSLHP